MPHFGMQLVLAPRMELRQQLAMRLEMRLEQRLELSLRLTLQQHQLMGIDGVDDPMRVRYFEVPKKGRGKKKMRAIAKIYEGAGNNHDAAIDEALNWEQFRKLGFETPEILGLLKSQDQSYLLSKFEDKAANFATLVSDPKILAKFIKHSKSASTDVSTEELFSRCGTELARLHLSGIDKENFCPRNIMIRLDPEGYIIPVHTGFSRVKFGSEPLNEKQRNSSLEAVMREFARLTEVTKTQLAAFAEGYSRYETLTFKYEPGEVVRALRDKLLATLSTGLPDGIDADADKGDEEGVEETFPSLSDKFEQIALEAPEYKGENWKSDKYLQDIRKKWHEAVCSLLPTEDVCYKEARTHKLIQALFRKYVLEGSVAIGDAAELEDDELRMDPGNASKLTKAIFKKYNIPKLGALNQTLWTSMALRTYRQLPPNCSHADMQKKMRKQFRGAPERRTIAKYMNQLKSAGKIPTLDSKLLRKAYDYSNQQLEAGDILTVEACSEELQLPADQIEFVIDNCKRNYLTSAIESHVKGENEIDVPTLSTQLDMDSDAIIETIVAREPEYKDRIMSVLEEPEENEEPESEPAEDNEVQQPQPGTDNEVLEDQLAALIDNNPHLTDQELADMLSIDDNTTQALLHNLKVRCAVDEHRQRVCRLVMSQPGIDDNGIMEETGLSITTIHLALREALLRGEIRE